jgi:hypothetical protein
MSPVFSFFNSCHSFELGKLFKYLDYSQYLLSKSYFSCFQTFCSIFYQFREKFNEQVWLFEKPEFSRHKWNNPHWYLTIYYSTIAHAAALFEVENDSANISLSTHYRGSTWQQQ